METSVTIRTRKLMNNRLLGRRQMVLDMTHPSRPSIPKKEVRDNLAKLFKSQPDLVFCYGFKCAFGGGRSTGFALVYDNMDIAKKVEPKYRLVRQGVINKPERMARKQRKERKNRMKKARGTAKAAKAAAAKK